MKILRDFDLWFLIEDSKKYRMILYTDLEYLRKIQKLMENLDVSIAYAVGDSENSEVCSVYELLYEDPRSIMVVVVKKNFYSARKILEGMGLKLGVHFKSIQRFLPETHEAPYYYDPICGYNLYTDSEELQGFRVFGEPGHSKALRILTMGGSTTDDFLYPFRSWSEFLHCILESKGIKNVVLCGGVGGFRSSEELFKIIRDGIGLKPDMVLNFSGSNDLSIQDYPYINGYMRSICSYLEKQKNQLGTRFQMNPFGITLGTKMNLTETGEDSYSFWFRNQKMIHAVCESFCIQHLTFFQPNMVNGKKLSEYEQAYLLNACYWGIDKMTPEQTMKRALTFRKCVERDALKENWLVDLSGIFDEEDVYIDRLHVNETGNRLIAENIVCEMERLCMI